MTGPVTTRIYRYAIPVDSEAHDLNMTPAPVLAVAAKHSAGDFAFAAEFWAEDNDQQKWVTRTFTVIGTGFPVPDGYSYRGTCGRLDGLVWHLYERVAS